MMLDMIVSSLSMKIRLSFGKNNFNFHDICNPCSLKLTSHTFLNFYEEISFFCCGYVKYSSNPFRDTLSGSRIVF